MAENTDTLHGRHEMSSDVNLTPEDIPCSSVKNGEDISKWTIPQLKFWLKCRRLNQQGLKKDLVEKVKALNAIPYYREKVYDPDS
ncbi:unnamed protein product [Porites evermanni]|uniref:SAP domain-containing protein n=1 Tax=Porites evermanni TaxID=104178 RepID=A0ABN8T1K9_9CNID|nr:unnamed protein product [Porites evermanni]